MKSKWFFIVILGFLLFTGPVHAETTNCTAITSVPFTISTAGIYCLNEDFNTSMSSGTAISIGSDNVVLDLNGHKVDNAAAGAGTYAYGIHASSSKNIKIKNGTVRGFQVGVDVGSSSSTDGQAITVEDLTLDLNTYIGINMHGSGIIVRNNHILNTGINSSYGSAYGISASTTGNSGNSIINNEIFNTRRIAISIRDFSGFVVNNRISNLRTDTNYSYGISASGTGISTITGNEIMSLLQGIYCASTANGKIRDNIVSGATYPYTGCNDAGNNN